MFNYIYNNCLLNCLFFKSGSDTVLGSLWWCQRNLFHCIAMNNEWLRFVWNFKIQLLGIRLLILFFLWKWIKCSFVLFVLIICIKKMPGVKSIAMKSNRTTILTGKKIGAGPSFHKIFIIHPRKKHFKSNWCRISFQYRSCSCTFSVFWIISKKCTFEYVCPPIPPQKFVYIYRYILDIKHYSYQISW